jgi:hypothetical protein
MTYSQCIFFDLSIGLSIPRPSITNVCIPYMRTILKSTLPGQLLETTCRHPAQFLLMEPGCLFTIKESKCAGYSQ